jgi:hypothetical protein
VNLPKIAKNPDDPEARKQMLCVELSLKFGGISDFEVAGWHLLLLVLVLEMLVSTYAMA